MNSNIIYEKITNEYLRKMKAIRDLWPNNESVVSNEQYAAGILDIKDHNYTQYEYIMNRSSELVHEMIYQIILSLLQFYKIPVIGCDIRKSISVVYYYGKEQKSKKYIDDSSQESKILAFARIDDNNDNKGILFVFKDFGFDNRLPASIQEELLKYPMFKCIKYISFVEDNAFSEILNHNDNEEDPARGTDTYSLKFFFNTFFGVEEYDIFKKYLDSFFSSFRNYLGLNIVQSLKPNTMFGFQKNISNNLRKIDIILCNDDFPATIDNMQKRIIDEQFYQNKYISILLGRGEFATSFRTAEWLYSSLKNVGNVDLSAVVLGYFKSIEQFLFQFVTFHTKEQDSVHREIYANSHYNELTDDFINNSENIKKVTLTSLLDFLGFYNSSKDNYKEKNTDLLRPNITNESYHLFIKHLERIKTLRNDHLHKDNLYKWETVDEIRRSIYAFYYFFLGSYEISDEQLDQMGDLSFIKKSDFALLCEYIYDKYRNMRLNVPVYYIKEEEIPNEFYSVMNDLHIEYEDITGNPIYSGLYLKKVRTEKELLFTPDNPPDELWEGEISPVGPKFINFKPAKKIYSNGKFLLQE